MWTSRVGFGRRPCRRASVGVVLLIVVGLLGYDHLLQAQQEQEAWSGTMVRVYAKPGYLGGRKSSARRYWDVRTADGEVRSVRIWSRSLWNDARPGDWLIKRGGELHPDLLPRR
jgi:hypothetical protein